MDAGRGGKDPVEEGVVPDHPFAQGHRGEGGEDRDIVLDTPDVVSIPGLEGLHLHLHAGEPGEGGGDVGAVPQTDQKAEGLNGVGRTDCEGLGGGLHGRVSPAVHFSSKVFWSLPLSFLLIADTSRHQRRRSQ